MPETDLWHLYQIRAHAYDLIYSHTKMKHFFFIELLCFVVNIFFLIPDILSPIKAYSESLASLFITFVKEWIFRVLYFAISLITLLPIFKLVCFLSVLKILHIFWIQVISLTCKWQMFSPIDLFGFCFVLFSFS